MLLFVTLVLCLPQEVIITLDNGKVVSGHLQGYRDGKYLVHDGSELLFIDETKITDVTVVKKEGKKPEPPQKADDDIEKILFEQKDYQKAIVLLHKQKRDGKKLQDLLPYMKIAHVEYMTQCIKLELVNQLENNLEFIKHELPEKEAGELADFCYLYFKEYASKFKSLKFTSDLARVMAKTILQNGLLKDKKQDFESELIDLGEAKLRLMQYSQARSVYEILYSMDNAKYSTKLVDTFLLEASTLLLDKDFKQAELVLDKATRMELKDERLTDYKEKVKFESFKVSLQKMPKSEKLQALIAYRRDCSREDFLKWIDMEVRRIEKTTEEAHKQIKDITFFYPIEPKMWYKYRYAHGEIIETVTIDSVQKENNSFKIFISQERIFKTHKYPVEISRKEINEEGLFNVVGDEKSPLIKVPIQVGSTWTIERGLQRIKRTILSVSQSIKTAAGSFEDCLAVEVRTTADANGSTITITATEYYAPHVGLVKMELLEQNFAKYSIELIEYGKK